jgi:hypothetical protein
MMGGQIGLNRVGIVGQPADDDARLYFSAIGRFRLPHWRAKVQVPRTLPAIVRLT